MPSGLRRYFPRVMIVDTSSNALLRHPSASDFRGKPDIARTRTNSVTAKRWWASRFSSRGVWRVLWSHSLEAAATGTIAEAASFDIETLRDERDSHAQDILLDSVEVEE